MDRINKLPDDIICHILSFLPTKEAALTSVLSKRWRNLFVFTSNLCFEGYLQDRITIAQNKDITILPKEKDITNFVDFVDRVLAASGNFSIKKFTLRCGGWVASAHTNRLIYNVLKRGVMDLDLYRTGRLMDSLPLEVFTCKTIVNLKLGKGFIIPLVPESAFLPALRTLFLDSIEFCCEFEALLSACHVLEELTIQYCMQPGWCHRVSSMSLQRLTINSKFDLGNITIDTPSLAYLHYSGSVIEYVMVNPQDDWSILHVESSPPTNLIKGLRNVEMLNLSSIETSEIFYSFRDAIPVFEKLSRLSIVTDQLGSSCWKLVPLLLKNTPNLKTLVIKGPLHYCDKYGKQLDYVCECLSGYSFLSSCHVKVLEITEYRGTKGELEQMKHIIEKLPCLELVKVRAWAVAKFLFTKDLLMLPSAGKIQLKFCQASKN